MKEQPARRLGMFCALASVAILLGLAVLFAPVAAESISPLRAPRQAPSRLSARTTTTNTLYLPLVLKPAPPIKFTLIGYDTGLAGNYFEHVHLCDNAGASTDMASWRIHSSYTNDDYYFPAGARAQNCPSETTLNTSYAANVDNVIIFNWGKPASTDEWPNTGGVTFRAYFYDASNQLAATCVYTPAPPGDNGNANCD